ncbi:MAG: PD40 domain-containing protein [Gemmatimonadetes bacterium]|nr:PD40 domain-containing protein [Gemmatimonadota bacterium]
MALRFRLCVFLLLPFGPLDAQGRPSTDIWLVPLEGRGVPRAGRAENLTARLGYDNQPAFTADGQAVLYTAIADDGPSDIWRLDLVTRERVNLTRTVVESEYSATPMPDGLHYSTIRVEADSTQRLWRFALRGDEPPALLFEAIQPVGYHVWASDALVGLYVLGAPLGAPGGAPATLQLADVRTGTATVMARDIGRALQKIPGRDAISFVQQGPDGPWITALDLRTGGTARIARAPAQADYHVWTPDGVLLTGSGSRVLAWVDGRWDVVADLAADGVRDISRLALSPTGDRLALVAEDRANR